MAVLSEVLLSEVKKTWRFDAEYWDPVYLRNEEAIANSGDRNGHTVRSVYDLVREIKGSAFYPTFVGYYSDSGMPFIRVTDIGYFFLKEDQIVRVSPEVIEAYKQISVISEGDIVLSKGGSIGEVSIVQEGLGECALCRDAIALQCDDTRISAYYLTAFLKSRFGQLQLDRNKSQQVQAHLTFPALGTVQVAVPPRPMQDRIASQISEAYVKIRDSRDLYAQAERLLLEELGIEQLDLSPTLFYERSYSEAHAAARLDSEYFMPRFYRLLNAILKTGKGCWLGGVLEHCDRGLQPEYDDGGEIAVVNTKHMGPQFLSGDYERCTADAWDQQKKAHLKQYDVLFYSTGAYIGRTNCWFQTEKAIGSNHVTIIRPKAQCNPVYLSLFLNSEAGRMQADRHAHGSAQREVYPSDIRDFKLWLPPMKKQERFAEMILQAKSARDESRRLLEEAKRMVEEAVLGE